MRFGVQLYPWARWPELTSIGIVAQAADRLGYDSLVFSEHIVTPLVGDEPPIGRTWPEIHVLSAYLAALTERVRFVFYATVVPYRHPIHQANLVATLDQLSGGRVTLVAGLGWLREEFDVLGVPFSKRGARTDEHLAVMRALWTQPEVEFHGEFVSFEKAATDIKCVQSPHVPIWIGGVGRHARRRIVEYGDGWGAPIPWPLDKLADQVARIKREAEAAGRDPATLSFAAGLSFGVPDRTNAVAFAHAGSIGGDEVAETAEHALDLVGRYAGAGITHLVLGTDWSTPDDYCEKLEWFADNVMGLLG